MNIWLINHYAVPPQYYPLARPTNFAKYLMRAGHQVTIFAASTVHNSTKNLITDDTPWKEEIVNDVHYVYIKCRDYQGNGLSRIYNMMEFAWKLAGVCKHFARPDALVATSMPPMSCAAGIRLARKYGCRGIAEIADLWPESIIAYGIAGKHNPAVLILRRLEKWIYTKADAIVFTMEGGKDYIIEQGWDTAHGGPVDIAKVHHINNGVDLEAFEYNKEHCTFEDADLDDPDTFKVIYTGSIRTANKVDCLVEVAKQLRKKSISSIKILLWGTGNQCEAIQAKIDEEQLTNIILKGVVPKGNIPYILLRSSLNVLEGEKNDLYKYGISQNKLFEYFASGKPVLASVNSGYSIIDRYQCGVCLDDFTPEAMADAIIRMSTLSKTDYESYCKNALRAAQDYDFKVLTDKLISAIEMI